MRHDPGLIQVVVAGMFRRCWEKTSRRQLSEWTKVSTVEAPRRFGYTIVSVMIESRNKTAITKRER